MSMSVTGVPQAPPRVRHQAREALAVMAFSAVMSVAISVALLTLMFLGRQG
jgi:hypothetical protein